MENKTIVSLIVYFCLYAYFWNENRIGLHEGIDKDPKSSLDIMQIIVANFHMIFKASICAIGLFIVIFLLSNVMLQSLQPRIGLREEIISKHSYGDKPFEIEQRDLTDAQQEHESFVKEMPFVFNIIPKQFSLIFGTFIICAMVTVFLSIAGKYTMTKEKFDTTQGHIFIDIICTINFATFVISLVFLVSRYGDHL